MPMRLGMSAAVCLIAFLGSGYSTAQPQSAIARGDVLYIEVYRVPEMTQSYLVRQDGTITVPYVGNVGVAGLNESAAEANIAAALTKILRNPRVTVTKSDVGLMSPATGRSSEMLLEIVPLLNSHAETMSTTMQGMSSAGGHISFDPDTNSLLITDTPEAIKNMMSVIGRLDKMKSQMTQVRIESKIAEVRIGALQEMGVKWFFQGRNLSGGFNPSDDRISQISNLGGNLGSLDNELINPGTGGSFGRQFVGEFDRRLNIPAMVPLAGQAFLGFSTSGIDLGILIDALVSDEKAKLLANPAILTVNHKKAVLKMVDEFPYTEFGTEITGAQRFSIAFLELGIILEVTPHVYSDEIGPYVKLDLHPEISFPTGIVNGVPIRSVRSSDTVANVRNNKTLVISGIISEDEQNVVTKIPGIGSLPIIGALFRHKEKVKLRTELMIFVTPTIYETPELITWDKMIDIAKELNDASAIPIAAIRGEARKD